MAINEKNLFIESGYINMPEIIDSDYTFIILITGRGTGKTYGALKHMLDINKKFIYMRRTDTQVQGIANVEMNVFNWLNEDEGKSIYPFPVAKGLYGYYNSEIDEETSKYVKTGECIGLLGALSTLSNKRGFSGADIEYMILDEFCPEAHERPLKNESSAILNCYETINRNRELQGRKPLKLIMLANSNSIGSQTLLQFGIVKIVTNMKKKGIEIYKDDKRSMLVVCPSISPIGEKKKDTALYRLIGENSSYSRMALNNQFNDAVFNRIGGRPIKEYRPLVKVADLCIYKHKKLNEFYVSTHESGSPAIYSDTKEDIKKFRNIYKPIYSAYVENRICFENEETQVRFIDILNK